MRRLVASVLALILVVASCRGEGSRRDATAAPPPEPDAEQTTPDPAASGFAEELARLRSEIDDGTRDTPEGIAALLELLKENARIPTTHFSPGRALFHT